MHDIHPECISVIKNASLNSVITIILNICEFGHSQSLSLRTKRFLYSIGTGIESSTTNDLKFKLLHCFETGFKPNNAVCGVNSHT